MKKFVAITWYIIKNLIPFLNAFVEFLNQYKTK